MDYLGIDLGTTYSCISVLDDYSQEPRSLTVQGGGGNIIPSVVYFHENGKRIVGLRGKSKLRTDPKNTVELAKRYMGTDKKWIINGKEYTPVDISSIIIKELFDAYLADHRGGDCEVVITCPANYSALQRELVKKAACMAGILSPILLNEPTAAAISYCSHSNFKLRDDDNGIIVYDLGGGTLDVTALSYDRSNDHYEVYASDGISDLGGADWDAIVENRLLEQLSCNSNESVEALRNNPKVFGMINWEAEEKKKMLTSGDVEEDVFIGGYDCPFTYTQAQFENDSEHLLTKSLDLFDSVLDVVQVSKNQHGSDFKVGAVILVGGSSYMPQIKKGIESRYPNFKGKVWMHDPDHSVSQGAAIFCKKISLSFQQEAKVLGKQILSESEKLSKMADTISEVLPTTFGLAVHDKKLDRERCMNFIFKNDKIPIEVSKTTFLRFNGQSDVHVNVYMNNCRDKITQEWCELEECQFLNKFSLKLAKPGRANDEFHTTFIFNIDGTLNLRYDCNGNFGEGRVDLSQIQKNMKRID